MLEAVYVDNRDEQSVVAIRPKPSFAPLFEIALTREGSGVTLVKEPPPVGDDAKAVRCSWWRRGRGDLSLKHGLVVWVIDGWPADLAVDDDRSAESPLAQLSATDKRFDLVAA
jgi:hypothetical protein